MHESVTRRLRRTRGDEAGFTLMELVLTVAIIGIITVALSGVVIVFLRNTAETQARLTESHDVQFAAAYWQRDIGSLGLRGTTPNPTSGIYPLTEWSSSAPCGNVPAGYTPTITFVWGDYTSKESDVAADPVKVTYAYRVMSGSAHQLIRVRCLSAPSVVTIADNLTGPPTVFCDGSETTCGPSDPTPRIVSMKLTIHDNSENHLGNYEATLTGERRQS